MPPSLSRVYLGWMVTITLARKMVRTPGVKPGACTNYLTLSNGLSDMRLRSVLTVYLSCIFACLFGCGGDKLDLVPVKGTVLLDGKPITKIGQGGVSFFADASKGNQTQHIPTGAIDADGNYELQTGGQNGAPLGTYKVLVNVFQNTPDEGPVTPRMLLHPKYYDLTKTDISVEVVAKSSPGQYDLKVIKK